MAVSTNVNALRGSRSTLYRGDCVAGRVVQPEQDASKCVPFRQRRIHKGELFVVVVAIVVAVAISVLVPSVIVGYMAALAIPIAGVVVVPIMMRRHPSCTAVRRAAVVSLVPLVVVPYGIPVSTYPDIVSARTPGLHSDDAHRWRRADMDSN